MKILSISRAISDRISDFISEGRGGDPPARPNRGRLLAALGGGFLAAGLVTGSASAQNVTGTVYRDFNANGSRELASPAEPGVGGVTVTVYDASGAVAAAVTGSDGSYSVAGGAASTEIRVEFTGLPSYLRASAAGTASRTTVAFVTLPASGDATGVDLAVANPAQHCQDDPDMVTSCYIVGDQSGPEDVLVSFPYTASGNTPAPATEATESQIGTTWGAAYQRSSDSLFTAAFQKRHSGYGDGSAGGTGAIYRIVDPSDGTTGGISTFLNLNTLFGSAVAGTNPHPTGSDFDLDVASYDAAGKVAFGDMDLSEDELTLWVVNLSDRRLYEIPLGSDPANPVAPALASQVERHDLFDLADCDGDGSNDNAADVDLRPFGLKVHDGSVYVGAVCSAESTQDPADLRALVFAFDPVAETFSGVLDFSPLTYDRGEALSGGGCAGGAATWSFWETTYPPAGLLTLCTLGGGVPELSYPQPMLADLEFAADGTLLLGLRDRFGDQQGFFVEDPLGTVSAGDGYGDLLRATPDGMGQWSVSTAEATDGSEFFADDDWTDTTFIHNETGWGGLALRPGNAEVLYTRLDPLDGGAAGSNDFSGGVRWKSTLTGATGNQYEIYDPDAGDTGIFGKGNGLGDLEAICEAAPIQIGNRLWIDLDRDGVQDPGEPPLAGVEVELIDSDGTTVLATATTGAGGLYSFSNGNGTTTASDRFGIAGLTPNSGLSGSSFTLRVDLSQAALGGYYPTFADADSSTHGDARDSDGVQSGGNVDATFATGLSGTNDHTLDLGFIQLDDTAAGDLRLSKSVSPAGLVGPGEILTYTLTVENTSASVLQSGIRIWDVPPAGSGYLAQSTVVEGFRVFPELQVADEFATVSFSNDDGSDAWAGGWIENDAAGAGPAAGNVTIAGGLLQLDDVPDTGTEPSLAREVDLSGYTSATLRFAFQTTAGVDATDAVTVEASNNGGGAFVPLEVITGISGAVSGARTYNLTPFLSANTQIRFRVSNLYGGGGESFQVLDVEVTAAAGRHVRDEFTAATYANNDGNDLWAGTWIEDDTAGVGPLLGNVVITGGFLQLDDQPDTGTQPSLAREVDLSGALAATLRFDFETTAGVDAGDAVTVEASSNGGASFSPLEVIAGLTGVNAGQRTFDLTPFIAADTRIRFRVSNLYGGGNEFFRVRDVEITTTDVQTARLDNVPGGADPDLANGDPSELAVLDDNLVLPPSSTMTVTFQAVVDDPLTATRLLCVATADSNEAPPTSDFAENEARAAALGDLVWLDVDADAVFDVGEAGLANVEVTLVDAGPDMMIGGGDDVVLGTTLTAADGSYRFDGLAAGSYYAQVTGGVPAGLALTTPGASNPAAVVTLAAGDRDLDSDFPFTNADSGNATIGDLVWSDADDDGVRDPGEPGIGGVTLELRSAGADGVLGSGDDVVEQTVTTPADGRYLFTNVSPGQYSVAVTDANNVLTGYALTTGPQSVASPSQPISVAANDLYLQADFGYFQAGLGSIGTQVWLDADVDGTFQSGSESGIAGVTLDLVLDANGSGMQDAGELVIATALTGAGGSYSFDGLLLDDGGGDADADYLVIVTDAGGVLASLTQVVGPDPGSDGNSQQEPYAVALSAGSASDVTADFGLTSQGRIGDLVWSDADGDGIKDAAELGLAGVTVELYFDRDGDGAFDPVADDLLDTAVTDAFGNYLFDGLAPGTYFANVDPAQAALAGFTLTTADDDPADAGGEHQQAESLATPGESNLDADFGYRSDALPDLSGNVWNDVDRDARDDGAGEPGLAGVTLALIDSSGNVVATTTTDAGGDYLFADLPSGDYSVAVTDDLGVLDDYELTSGLDVRDVTVAAVDVTGVDFGYARTPATGAIGDTVWLDVDPPGPDGPDGLPGPNEPRLSGVTLLLYRDLDGDGVAEPGADDGAAIATTVTDAGGRYLVDGLPAGSYFVDVDGSTLPAGLVTTAGTSDPSGVVNLGAGERFEDADFGYLPAAGTGALGDSVWYDADGDGLQDPGEVGIGGVDVTYIGAGPDGQLGTADDTTGTTTTTADGSYLFTGLAPDEYIVFFDGGTLPAGYSATPTNTGADSTYNVTLASGGVVGILDWGFDGGGVGSLGDRVWFDRDGDGNQDAGEPGIGGVTLNLIGPGANGIFGDGDDEILATTTTDSGGGYLFAGVPLGADYQVEVTDLDGLLAGLNRSSSLPGTLAPTAGTPDLLTADFGYAPFGGSGSIGTTVWHDLDGDGVRDLGEPPIEGVTVAVWRDVDGNGAIDPGGDNLLRSAPTDANGNYELKGLPPGDYLVDVTDASGVLTGFTKTAGAAGSDDNSQADPYPLTLTAGSPDDVTADFGYRDDVVDAALSISGTVFEDENVNAAFDEATELRAQNVEVLLYRLAGGERVLIGRTFTDVNGDYAFTDLPPGDYEVEVDPTATAVDGFAQTTQTTTGGAQPVTLVNSDSVDNDFGFFDDGVALTPVTLSYFEARGGPGDVEFDWRTATEVGHVGFNLWQWSPANDSSAGGWQRVNPRIIPSSGVDSIEMRAYSYPAQEVEGSVFLLEDLDIRGGSTFHGPFELGKPYGSEKLENRPIDWAAIRGEHLVRKAERASAALRSAEAGKMGSGAVKLLVEEDGVYRVTYEDLKAAGLDLAGVDPDEVALLDGGEPWPLRVEGPAPRFGPGSFVEFVGFGLDTLYTRTNVYRLQVDPPNARRVAVDRSRPGAGKAPESYVERLRVERDLKYSFASPNGDPWFDTEILSFDSPASATFPFETEGRLAGAGTLEMTVGLWGVTGFAQAPDHHVVLEINGVQVADEFFDGLVDHPVTFEVPESVLVAGTNVLEVILPGDTGADFDLVNVDAYALSYPRRFRARDGGLLFEAGAELFEVEGLTSPDLVVYRQTGSEIEWLSSVEVTGTPGSYTARIPGSSKAAIYRLASGRALRSPGLELARPAVDVTTGLAELLILSHPDFLSGLETLASARRAQGWTVKIVDVEDVYARFGGDHVDPQAIRAYVAFAAENLGTEAVLLAGGDTYDYFDHLGLGSVSFIPSLYGRTGEFVYFAPADGLYTDLDGDEVPDLAIGRFPVRTRLELAQMITRTLDYERRQDRRSVLLAADDYDVATRFDFTQVSEQLALRIPPDWQVHRAFLDALGVDGARSELLRRLDQGVAVTSFMGHSGPITWSFDGLFRAADAAELRNAGLPTVVTQWGCWTTYYVSPRNDTLAHELLLNGDRGAAAVLGATTLTEARSERALGLEIFGRLFTPGETLGGAILKAKRALAASQDPAVLDVLLGWNLLGDPTLGLEAKK